MEKYNLASRNKTGMIEGERMIKKRHPLSKMTMQQKCRACIQIGNSQHIDRHPAGNKIVN